MILYRWLQYIALEFVLNVSTVGLAEHQLKVFLTLTSIALLAMDYRLVIILDHTARILKSK